MQDQGVEMTAIGDREESAQITLGRFLTVGKRKTNRRPKPDIENLAGAVRSMCVGPFWKRESSQLALTYKLKTGTK